MQVSYTSPRESSGFVGIFNEQARRYHLYLTNLAPEQMGAEELASVYQARWLVELAFHDASSTLTTPPCGPWLPGAPTRDSLRRLTAQDT
jgi:hypothetical protein